MKNIRILDCTLRDGGYVNDWNFGHSVITGIYKRLESAHVEYIEVGFIDDRVEFDINKSISPNTEGFNKIFEGIAKRDAVPIAMIDYGTCSIDNIQDCKDSFIDGIRVIFKKEKIKEALPFCKKIKDKGYKLFIQAISITSYSDMEMLEYLKKINEIQPYAFSIVDTYGLLDDRRLKNYFYIIDNNLSPLIKMGYHAHNNFQLAFSNSIKFLGMQTKREIIVDSTVYGMGKSAGNCPSELIAMHMNRAFDKIYDLNQFLEILDTDLMPVYIEHYWGYKYNFYISALQNVHPNYVKFLLDKKSLSITSINEILKKIPDPKRLSYDEKLISEEYEQYQIVAIDDFEIVRTLQLELGEKEILLIGPGGSISTEKNKCAILQYVHNKRYKIISVNFLPETYKVDYIFISNSKRYSKLIDRYNDEFEDSLIITSNIRPYGCKPKYIINMDTLLKCTRHQGTDGLILCMGLLRRMRIRKVILAGFDGFTARNDYYNMINAFAGNEDYRLNSNDRIRTAINNMESDIAIEFLTESIYQEKK